MGEIRWPDRWQPEARAALIPYFGADVRVRIIVDDPATAIDGTVIEGYAYLDEGTPMIIHDRSGRTSVYPWRILLGPVLRIYELRPRKKPLTVYGHSDWRPRHGEPPHHGG